jgi:hypothetical protein
MDYTAAAAVQEQQNRVDFLETLYLLDGRNDSTHPLHSRYTGLAEEFCYSVGRMMMRDVIAAFDDPEIRASLASEPGAVHGEE